MIRVSLNPQGWDTQPRRLYAERRVIRLAWFALIDPQIVGIGSTALERITLCLVPSSWPEERGRSLFRAVPDRGMWPTETNQLLALAASRDDQL